VSAEGSKGEHLAERRMTERSIGMNRLLMHYLERLRSAVQEIELPTGEKVSRCIYSPHSLRATTATLLLDAGEAITSGTKRFLVYGSANFTSPALLRHGRSGNIETVVVVPDISEKELNPRRFCDPSGSAYHLRSPDQLQSATRDAEDHLPAMPIRLNEAVLADDRLMVRACVPSDIQMASIALRLHVQGSRGQVLPISRISEERFSTTVPERSVSRLQELSTLASIETAAGHEQLSNLVFVTNLLDIKTQNSVRRERHIREATQSAGQFFSVLNDLLRAGDNAALLTFLNFCDIPLVNAPRPPALRNRPVWEGQEGMRHLGERNLQICKTLHDATLKFFERHLKKLKRHTESLAIEGVSNFLQIFLSMGSLLRMQVERVVLALEARPTEVRPEQWGECRELWDVYFLKFRELMECLWDDYLRPLGSECARKDIQQEFGQDLEAIHELCDGGESRRCEATSASAAVRTAARSRLGTFDPYSRQQRGSATLVAEPTLARWREEDLINGYRRERRMRTSPNPAWREL